MQHYYQQSPARVRFADQSVGVYYDRQMPSPTSSDASLLLSSPVSFTVPLPTIPGDYMQGVHRAISASSSYPTHNVSLRTQHFLTTLSADVLSSSAVEQRCSKLRIYCPDLTAWNYGYIDVLPRSSSSRTKYVTVGDVLSTLYEKTRSQVTIPEMTGVTRHVSDQVNKSFQHRIALARSEGRDEAREKLVGYRRFDFLSGSQRFLGLKLDPNNGHGCATLFVR